MFNIGMSEMLVIAVVALMIFGPNELPEMLKKLGKGMREIRRASDDLKATVSLSLEDNERNKRPPAPVRPAPIIAPADGANERLAAMTDAAHAADAAETAMAAPVEPTLDKTPEHTDG
jgi:sec-independent protein translocase protein TatB